MSVLTCLDLDSFFSFFCGQRSKIGKSKLSGGESPLEQHGKADFDKFFAFVCSLDHMQKLGRDYKDKDLLFDHALAHIVLHNIKDSEDVLV